MWVSDSGVKRNPINPLDRKCGFGKPHIKIAPLKLCCNTRLKLGLRNFRRLTREICVRTAEETMGIYAATCKIYTHVYNLTRASASIWTLGLNGHRQTLININGQLRFSSPRSPCKNNSSFYRTPLRANELSTKDDATSFSHLWGNSMKSGQKWAGKQTASISHSNFMGR